MIDRVKRWQPVLEKFKCSPIEYGRLATLLESQYMALDALDHDAYNRYAKFTIPMIRLIWDKLRAAKIHVEPVENGDSCRKDVIAKIMPESISYTNDDVAALCLTMMSEEYTNKIIELIHPSLVYCPHLMFAEFRTDPLDFMGRIELITSHRPV